MMKVEFYYKASLYTVLQSVKSKTNLWQSKITGKDGNFVLFQTFVRESKFTLQQVNVHISPQYYWYMYLVQIEHCTSINMYYNILTLLENVYSAVFFFIAINSSELISDAYPVPLFTSYIMNFIIYPTQHQMTQVMASTDQRTSQCKLRVPKAQFYQVPS